MDLLSDELRALHVDQVNVESIELRGPWSVYVPTPDDLTSMIVVLMEGEMWVQAYGRPDRPMRWRTGDVGLLLPGYRFVARSTPTIEPRRTDELQPQLARDGRLIRWGAGPDMTRFTVLGCSMSVEASSRFTGAPSPVNRFDEQDLAASTLRSVLARQAARRAGADAVLDRMAEFVLVHGLSLALERPIPDPLSTVDDPRITRVLELLRSDLGRAWTGESLARRAGMSRTAFFGRFAAQVGESPIRYLTQRRLDRAQRLLTTSASSLDDIALRVGYSGSAALCRAFKRTRGVSPGELRRSGDSASRSGFAGCDERRTTNDGRRATS